MGGDAQRFCALAAEQAQLALPGMATAAIVHHRVGLVGQRVCGESTGRIRVRLQSGAAGSERGHTCKLNLPSRASVHASTTMAFLNARHDSSCVC